MDRSKCRPNSRKSRRKVARSIKFTQEDEIIIHSERSYLYKNIKGVNLHAKMKKRPKDEIKGGESISRSQ